jgi:PTH1 family peptidyl-tRNA hydrolase
MSNPPFLIVGLGNPGKEYANTRHNLGFVVIDKLINESEAKPVKTKTQAKAWGMVREGFYYSLNYLLPQTFMNLSGNAVSAFMKEKKIDLKNLIVVHDDLDIPFGEIRVSKNSSAAGHNGVQSVIDALGTKDFTRIRIGIGRPVNDQPIEDYVLTRFNAEEKKQLPEIIDKSILEIEKLFSK